VHPYIVRHHRSCRKGFTWQGTYRRFFSSPGNLSGTRWLWTDRPRGFLNIEIPRGTLGIVGLGVRSSEWLVMKLYLELGAREFATKPFLPPSYPPPGPCPCQNAHPEQVS